MEQNQEPISYHGYLDLVRLAHDAHPQWRAGQALFNVLHRIRPDLSERVRATKLDPFNRDTRNPAFLNFVKENW